MSNSENGHPPPGSGLAPQVSVEEAEALLAKALVMTGNVNEELERARAARADAENVRGRAQAEALEAAEKLRTKLVTEAERQVQEARELNTAAEGVKLEAERLLQEAQKARAEAQAYREQVQHQAREEAQRVLEEAHAGAREETAELKRHASIEIAQLMRDVEILRAAAQEELEAQRILTSAARIRALSPALGEQAWNGAEPSAGEKRNGEAPAARKRRAPRSKAAKNSKKPVAQPA